MEQRGVVGIDLEGKKRKPHNMSFIGAGHQTRSMYTCNERHTRSFILLVLLISCPSPTRSIT